MIPKVNRGVSAVRARNSTLPSRCPCPGGMTTGSTGPILPESKGRPPGQPSIPLTETEISPKVGQRADDRQHHLVRPLRPVDGDRLRPGRAGHVHAHHHDPVRDRVAADAGFCLWPFGRVIVHRGDAGGASVIGNVIWVILAGWWLALGHLITGILLCITIIGIPLGLANFKLIPVSLTPFGREIVDADAPAATAGVAVAARNA